MPEQVKPPLGNEGRLFLVPLPPAPTPLGCRLGLQKQGAFADTNGVMTATLTRTLYAPNPPQLDDPWVKIVLLVLLGAAAIFGFSS